MALTRDFKESILAGVQRAPKFRNALLEEGIETLLAGDVDTGKAILRDIPAALADPHTAHRGMVVPIGEYKGVASPIKLSRTPATCRVKPPKSTTD